MDYVAPILDGYVLMYLNMFEENGSIVYMIDDVEIDKETIPKDILNVLDTLKENENKDTTTIKLNVYVIYEIDDNALYGSPEIDGVYVPANNYKIKYVDLDSPELDKEFIEKLVYILVNELKEDDIFDELVEQQPDSEY